MKYSGFEIINEERRQHINLSDYAMKVIDLDMVNFGFDLKQKNKSGFLNKVLSNYYDQFPLAPSQVLQQIREIVRTIKGEEFTNKLINVISNEFSEEFMRREIEKYSEKYGTENKIKIKINKENAELLEAFEEAHYYYDYAPRQAGLAFYLKIIFETYAELPRLKREMIFFREVSSVIEQAIETGHMIDIQAKDKSFTRIVPKEIFSPRESRSNILFFIEEIDDATEKLIDEGWVTIPADEIKIREICKVKMSNEVPKGLMVSMKDSEVIAPKPEKSVLRKIQYRVKFSNSGLRRYLYEEDSLMIKGSMDKDNFNVYSFFASPSEMFADLFKFGGTAKIISPQSEREKFAAFYRAAVAVYEEGSE